MQEKTSLEDTGRMPWTANKCQKQLIQVRIHPQTGKGVYFVKNFDTTALARPVFSWAGRTPRDDLIHPEEHLPN